MQGFFRDDYLNQDIVRKISARGNLGNILSGQ